MENEESEEVVNYANLQGSSLLLCGVSALVLGIAGYAVGRHVNPKSGAAVGAVVGVGAGFAAGYAINMMRLYASGGY